MNSIINSFLKLAKTLMMSSSMFLFFMLVTPAITQTSCNKSGCPTFDSANSDGEDTKKLLSKKTKKKKKKSGLLPDNGKKYFKKNRKVKRSR